MFTSIQTVEGAALEPTLLGKFLFVGMWCIRRVHAAQQIVDVKLESLVQWQEYGTCSPTLSKKYGGHSGTEK